MGKRVNGGVQKDKDWSSRAGSTLICVKLYFFLFSQSFSAFTSQIHPMPSNVSRTW